ncbi:hypothetical protein Cob_v000560 [Colletotrichum orbiculare MAFF 240422]|uniref:Uncharacterized protein n=1 Tax=Colletotrichum orbiculare (strain 104-T / ATCC 96160 / CBS 514.97 / LARS 414 / MAFF 240422) TaxID=1213857 RepID=N4V0J1_COLOR|nr:hypothetical protein Cob_v000560 [Colletotrichum orbiculare MAFF 240422]
MKISHSLILAVFARCGASALVAHCNQRNPLGNFNNCGSVSVNDCGVKCASSCFGGAWVQSMSWNPSTNDCDCWCDE